MADLLSQLLGFGSRKKSKNTKAARLRRKVAMIKKLQRKQQSPKYKRQKALDAALAAADTKLNNLRSGKAA